MLAFVISWFVVGFICMISIWIGEMRGKEFNENYFDKDCVGVSALMFALGYISPFIIYAVCTEEKKYFTRFVYKIANIGVKKDKVEEK